MGESSTKGEERAERRLSKREDRVIECDMSRDDVTSGKVKTPVPTMMVGVDKKETWNGSRCQFMWCGGGDVRVTETPKGMQV